MYILFAYDEYYPCGGANDAVGVFNSLEAAKAAYQGDRESAHIATFSEGELVVVLTGWSNPNERPRRIHWSDVPSAKGSTAPIAALNSM